jgi:hypothetical protein
VSALHHGSRSNRRGTRTRMFAARHAIAFALACAAACSRVPSAPASNPAAVQSVDMHAGGSATALIERIQDAALRVKHGGTRHLWFEYQSEGADHALERHTLEYMEHVTADGQGRFALDPGAIVQPAMNAQQREVFELLQKQREGFFFRYRDFGVRQRNLFQANYSVEVLGTPIAVAGRTCTQIDVRRVGKAHSKYRAAIDDATGLVMRWTETTLEGRIIASSEFVEFTLDPVLDGVDWFESTLQVQSLQSGPTLSGEELAALGFQPHTPQILPAGYQLLRSERVVETDGKSWLRRVYGDGLENLFVLERGSDPGQAGALHASTSGPSDQIVVRVCQAGAWTLAEVFGRSGQLFVVGKVGEDEVVDCLQSAF